MSNIHSEIRIEDLYDNLIQEGIDKGLPEEKAKQRADEFTQQPDWWIGGID